MEREREREMSEDMLRERDEWGHVEREREVGELGTGGGREGGRERERWESWGQWREGEREMSGCMWRRREVGGLGQVEREK